MFDEYDVYVAFRKAQANFFGRPYRLPKDWNKHFNTRMSMKNREALKLASKYFNTKWRNINMEKFFEVGFDLFGKSFSYIKFFDPKIMIHYIERDKIEKRNISLEKSSFTKSAKYVIKKWGKGRLKEYARARIGKESVPIRDYIRGDIDQFFLSWLIKERYLILEEWDTIQIPYIVEKYSKYRIRLNEMKSFIKEVEKKLIAVEEKKKC